MSSSTTIGTPAAPWPADVPALEASFETAELVQTAAGVLFWWGRRAFITLAAARAFQVCDLADEMRPCLVILCGRIVHANGLAVKRGFAVGGKVTFCGLEPRPVELEALAGLPSAI